MNLKDIEQTANWQDFMHHINDVPRLMKHFASPQNQEDLETAMGKQVLIALEGAGQTSRIQDYISITKGFIDSSRLLLDVFLDDISQKEKATKVLESIGEKKILNLLSNASSLGSEFIKDYVKKKGYDG